MERELRTELRELREESKTNDTLIKILVLVSLSLLGYLIATEIHYNRVINTYENTIQQLSTTQR